MACKCPRCGRDVASVTVYGESPIKAAITAVIGIPESVLNSTPFGSIEDSGSVISLEALNRAAIRVQQEIEREFTARHR